MKKLIVIFCIVCLLMTGCERNLAISDTEQQPDYATLVLALPSSITDADLIRQTESQMNDILRNRIGIQIRIIAFPIFDYHREVLKSLAGTGRIDLCLCYGTYVEDVLRGNLLPLEDLLTKYGNGIEKEVGKDLFWNCAVGGSVYGIPNLRDYAITTDTYCLNERILERCGFSAENIHSMEELEEVFASVHAQEPNVIIVSSNLQSLAANRQYLSRHTPYVSALDAEQDCYINYFTTEEYRQQLEQIRRWYEAGYIGYYIEAGELRQKEGVVLAESRCGKPGVEEEVSGQRGEKYRAVCFGKDITSTDVYTAITYSITKNTVSAEQSMQVLNELYTNEELNCLLMNIMDSWLLPNIFLTEPDEGLPSDIWEQTRRFNRDAEKMPDVGFLFDPSMVMKEYLDVCEVYQRYRIILENGITDPEEGLPRMLEELEQAGIDIVLEEQNRQYHAWKTKES